MVDLNTVKQDAQKGVAQVTSARNKFLDFVSNHPKTACFIIAGEAVALVVALLV